jgi:hypothetical protein
MFSLSYGDTHINDTVNDTVNSSEFYFEKAQHEVWT